jgi:hypothetical protein
MLTNHYDGCHAVCKTGRLRDRLEMAVKDGPNPQSSAEYNIVLYSFIELDIG